MKSVIVHNVLEYFELNTEREPTLLEERLELLVQLWEQVDA